MTEYLNQLTPSIVYGIVIVAAIIFVIHAISTLLGLLYSLIAPKLLRHIKKQADLIRVAPGYLGAEQIRRCLRD